MQDSETVANTDYSYHDLTDAELYLYSRHILLDDWDIDAQQRLKNSRILLIGAGGLGCTTAELLVRAGVGHMSIIDFDVIEHSNLQRQIAFKPKDIGQAKVDILVAHLRSINPYISVEAIHTKFDHQFIAHNSLVYDLILDGSDNFETRYLVNHFAMDHQIPLLSAAAIGFEGQLLFVTGQPCYACLFPMQEHGDERRCANSGVLTTTPAILASLQAHHALLFLGMGHAPLLNKLLIWNGLDMRQRLLNIQADPNCPVCQSDT